MTQSVEEIQKVGSEADPRLGLPSASADWFWHCPGSWRLRQTVPEIEEKPDEYIISGNKVDYARETGQVIDLNDEELTLYENGLKFEQRLFERWISDYQLDSADPGPCKERLWLNHPETMQAVVSGESDVHYVGTKEGKCYVLIVDWKLIGPNVSKATQNTQLRVLAVLKAHDMDNVAGIRVAVNRCAEHVTRNDYADYSPVDLAQSEAWIMWHLWLSQQEDAPLTPGRWCLHCKCKDFCPQAGAYAMLPSVIAARALPTSQDAESLVAALHDSDLIKLWEMKSIVENILKAVVTRLKGMGAKRLNELGLDYAKPRELNPITNTKGAYDFLQTIQNWPEQDLWNALEFSNTDLAKLAMREKGLDQKSATAWVRAALKDYITTKTCEAALKKI